MNWAIAGSFKLLNQQSTAAARLPSALAVLAMGLLIVACCGRTLTPGTGLAAAIMAATSIGLLAKARLAGAEIEGLYIPLGAMGTLFWMIGSVEKRSPWLLFLVSLLLQGIAALAKGPGFALLFHYAVVVGMLWKERSLRLLIHPAHILGLLLMTSIYLAWYVPYSQSPEGASAMEVMRQQGIERFTESKVTWGDYALNLPRGLSDLLPWLVLAPLLWRWVRGLGKKSTDPTDLHSRPQSLAMLAGAALPIAGLFVLVLLLPGALPRYALSAGPPFCLLAAVAMQHFHGSAWLEERFSRKTRIIAITAFVIATLVFGFVVAPMLGRRAPLHDLAAQIDRALSIEDVLFICDADDDSASLGAFFYLCNRPRYVGSIAELPPEAKAVLVHEKKRSKITRARPDLAIVRELAGKSGRPWLLMKPKDGATQSHP